MDYSGSLIGLEKCKDLETFEVTNLMWNVDFRISAFADGIGRLPQSIKSIYCDYITKKMFPENVSYENLTFMKAQDMRVDLNRFINLKDLIIKDGNNIIQDLHLSKLQTVMCNVGANDCSLKFLRDVKSLKILQLICPKLTDPEELKSLNIERFEYFGDSYFDITSFIPISATLVSLSVYFINRLQPFIDRVDKTKDYKIIIRGLDPSLVKSFVKAHVENLLPNITIIGRC